jgi:hypothetical protein
VHILAAVSSVKRGQGSFRAAEASQRAGDLGGDAGAVVAFADRGSEWVYRSIQNWPLAPEMADEAERGGAGDRDLPGLGYGLAR